MPLARYITRSIAAGTVAAALVFTLIEYHLGRPAFIGSTLSGRPAPSLVMSDDNGGIFDLAQHSMVVWFLSILVIVIVLTFALRR